MRILTRRHFPLLLTVAVLTCVAGLLKPAAVQAQIGGTPSAPLPSTPTVKAPASIAPPASELPTVARLVAEIGRAETSSDANALVYSYGEAVRDPQLARGAITLLLYDFYRLRAQASSAMQASQAVDEALLRFSVFGAAQGQANVRQNQQLVEQNARIIDQNDAIIKQNERVIGLLEQIARKK